MATAVEVVKDTPFTISGRTGDVVFRNMTVPIHSVLKQNDKMDPAPLKPPRPKPTRRRSPTR